MRVVRSSAFFLIISSIMASASLARAQAQVAALDLPDAPSAVMEEPSGQQLMIGAMVRSAIRHGMPLEKGGEAIITPQIVSSSTDGSVPVDQDQGTHIVVIDRNKNIVTLLINDQIVHLPVKDEKLFAKSQFTWPNTGPAAPSDEKLHWVKALAKSEFLIAGINLDRFANQQQTRDETIHGPFWKQLGAAERNSLSSKWNDGDPFITDYLQHPLVGGMYAQIWCDAAPKCRDLDFGWNKNYFRNGVLKPMGWAALMSLNFENGPISECTVGKVDYYKGSNGEYGVVDYFATPVIGILTKIAMDAYGTKFRRPFDRREAEKYQTYFKTVSQMAATNTITPEGLAKAEQGVDFSVKHKVIAIVVRTLDFDRLVSQGLEFKSGLNNWYMNPPR